MTWFVRPARADDAADLCRNCFPECSPSDVESYLNWCLRRSVGGHMVRLVIEADGQVVASGQLAVYRGCGEIASLVVAPAYRRQGMGDALLQALIAEAQQRRLDTLEIMAHAEASWVVGWYRRCGFEPVVRRVLPPDEPVVVLHRRVSMENTDDSDQGTGRR